MDLALSAFPQYWRRCPEREFAQWQCRIHVRGVHDFPVNGLRNVYRLVRIIGALYVFAFFNVDIELYPASFCLAIILCASDFLKVISAQSDIQHVQITASRLHGFVEGGHIADI